MFYFPRAFGSVQRGKAVFKYHRASGYLVWMLVLVNSILGTQSSWFTDVWRNTWVWILLGVITLAGVVSRVRLSKMKLI
jgi:hypothetical protein